MKFCPVCDNMLYMRTDDNLHLTMFCKNCAFSRVEDARNLSEPITDTRINYGDDENKQSALYIDESVRHDVTLPRVNNITCPNPNCSRPEGKDNEVIYVKSDPIDMKFVYCCCHCNAVWNKF
jgi:hypothetical protein